MHQTMHPNAHPFMHLAKMSGARPYDPHFVAEDLMHDIWRDFDKGVAQTLRRQRRARLLTALRRRNKQRASRRDAALRTFR